MGPGTSRHPGPGCDDGARAHTGSREGPTLTASAAIAELVVGGEPDPWRELGFRLDGARLRVGRVTVRVEPAADGGLVAWSLRGVHGADLDGLPTTLDGGASPAPAPPSVHANRASAIDHVVVVTPDLERTLAALAAAGLELRRRRQAGSRQRPEVQAFYRLGEVILEVVGSSRAPAGPARFWGLVFTVADLDGCAAALGGRLGPVHDAVQPGRRIAKVLPEAGLGLPVALMSPPPRRASAGRGQAPNGG